MPEGTVKCLVGLSVYCDYALCLVSIQCATVEYYGTAIQCNARQTNP